MDLDAISSALSNRSDEVAEFLVPDGKREGSRWVGHCAAGKVSVGIGRDRGRVFFCHGGGNAKNGGTILTLFQEVYGRLEGITEAKRFLGIIDGPEDGDARQLAFLKAEACRKEQESARLRDEAGRQENAAHIWTDSRSIAGTAAERYLVNRVRSIRNHVKTWPDCLRFHPRLSHPEGGHHPALVCRVDGVDGATIGVWRIYITDDGHKALVKHAKLGLGPCVGGAVRLFKPVSGHVGDCEGVETAFGAFLLTGVPTWACLSASGLAGFKVPFGIDRVTIFPDGDKWKFRNGRWIEPTGQRVANQLHDRNLADGIGSDLAMTPGAGLDYLDLWNRTQEFF